MKFPISTWGRVEQLFRVYSCSSPTFVFFFSFNFDLILGSVFYFLGPNWLFFGLEKGSKTVLESTHVVEQLSFCMFLSILTFDFDLILGLFLTFWVG